MMDNSIQILTVFIWYLNKIIGFGLCSCKSCFALSELEPPLPDMNILLCLNIGV